MEKAKRNKIILNSFLWFFITSIAIIYGTFLLSYVNKSKISQYTSLPWSTNIILISAILSFPTLIFELMYQHYHKKIYSKLPSTIYLSASFIFILAMFLGLIDCFVGKIPFSIIAILFLISFVFFIITLIKRFTLNN